MLRDGQGLEAEHHGDVPAGGVVDGAAAGLEHALALAGQRGVGHARVELEHRCEQPRLRLAVAQHDAAGGQLLVAQLAAELVGGAADAHRAGEPMGLEALDAQQVEQVVEPALVGGRQDHEAAVGVRPARRADLGTVIGEALQHRAPLAAQRLEVGERGNHLVMHRLAVAQQVGAALHAVLGDARLLVQDPLRAAQAGPGVRVARVPVLVPLARVIGIAVAVEGARLVVGEHLAHGAPVRRQVRVVRLARR